MIHKPEAYIAHLKRELAHAVIQHGAAKRRLERSEVAFSNPLASIAVIRRHALALANVQKWAGAVQRARTSLALMGVKEA
jgi:hypothetical protein